MLKSTVLLLGLFFCYDLSAATLLVAGAKGACKPFKFEGENGWSIETTRKLGGRWEVRDGKKNTIARIYCGVTQTEQKQLPEVETKDLKLGKFTVEKYTVTTSFPEEGKKSTEGLITSYTFSEADLKKLVIVSAEYDAASKLDESLEKALATIRIDKEK